MRIRAFVLSEINRRTNKLEHDLKEHSRQVGLFEPSSDPAVVQCKTLIRQHKEAREMLLATPSDDSLRYKVEIIGESLNRTPESLVGVGELEEILGAAEDFFEREYGAITPSTAYFVYVVLTESVHILLASYFWSPLTKLARQNEQAPA